VEISDSKGGQQGLQRVAVAHYLGSPMLTWVMLGWMLQAVASGQLDWALVLVQVRLTQLIK
jgi:hypothetical protein